MENDKIYSWQKARGYHAFVRETLEIYFAIMYLLLLLSKRCYCSQGVYNFSIQFRYLIEVFTYAWGRVRISSTHPYSWRHSDILFPIEIFAWLIVVCEFVMNILIHNSEKLKSSSESVMKVMLKDIRRPSMGLRSNPSSHICTRILSHIEFMRFIFITPLVIYSTIYIRERVWQLFKELFINRPSLVCFSWKTFIE